MGIDISAGVGYGVAVKVTPELKELAYKYLKGKKDTNLRDASFLPEILEHLYSVHPLLSLTSNFDENLGEEWFKAFIAKNSLSSDEKYESVRPTLLSSDQDEEALKELGTVLEAFNLQEAPLGWYFFKEVW